MLTPTLRASAQIKPEAGSMLTPLRGTRATPPARAILHAQGTPADLRYVAAATERIGAVILDVKIDREGRLVPPKGVQVGAALAADVVHAITKLLIEAAVARRAPADPRLIRPHREPLFARGERPLSEALRERSRRAATARVCPFLLAAASRERNR